MTFNKIYDEANFILFNELGIDSELPVYRCVLCGAEVNIDGSMSHRGRRLICNRCEYTKFASVLEARNWLDEAE